MDIAKIQKLSKQYESLRIFRDACGREDLELAAMYNGQVNSRYPILNTPISKLIQAQLRNVIYDAMKKLEGEIIQEANKI